MCISVPELAFIRLRSRDDAQAFLVAIRSGHTAGGPVKFSNRLFSLVCVPAILALRNSGLEESDALLKMRLRKSSGDEILRPVHRAARVGLPYVSIPKSTGI